MRDYEKISVYDMTTNPNTNYAELLHHRVFMMIVLHVVAYEFAVLLGALVVFAEPPSPWLLLRIAAFLLIIMPLGYVARLARAKHILLNHDIIEVKDRIRTAYYCWWFIG